MSTTRRSPRLPRCSLLADRSGSLSILSVKETSLPTKQMGNKKQIKNNGRGELGFDERARGESIASDKNALDIMSMRRKERTCMNANNENQRMGGKRGREESRRETRQQKSAAEQAQRATPRTSSIFCNACSSLNSPADPCRRGWRPNWTTGWLRGIGRGRHC